LHSSYNIEAFLKKINALGSEVDQLRKRVKELEYLEEENILLRHDNAILKGNLENTKILRTVTTVQQFIIIIKHKYVLNVKTSLNFNEKSVQ